MNYLPVWLTLSSGATKSPICDILKLIPEMIIHNTVAKALIHTTYNESSTFIHDGSISKLLHQCLYFNVGDNLHKTQVLMGLFVTGEMDQISKHIHNTLSP